MRKPVRHRKLFFRIPCSCKICTRYLGAVHVHALRLYVDRCAGALFVVRQRKQSGTTGKRALADRCLETTTRDQKQKRNRKLKMRKALIISHQPRDPRCSRQCAAGLRRLPQRQHRLQCERWRCMVWAEEGQFGERDPVLQHQVLQNRLQKSDRTHLEFEPSAVRAHLGFDMRNNLPARSRRSKTRERQKQFSSCEIYASFKLATAAHRNRVGTDNEPT